MQPSDELPNIIDEIDHSIISNLNNNMMWNYTNNKKKLIHYTSATVAREIIEKEQLWLRKTTFMNDYSEIIYGKQYFDNLLEHPKFAFILNNILKPFSYVKNNLIDFKQIYHQIINNVEKKIYISCLSEHLPEEDTIGRLSMWRAYGNSSGVALVINPKLLEKLTPTFITSPIIYSTEKLTENLIKILKDIDAIIKKDFKNIQKSDVLLKKMIFSLSYVVYIYVITLKHKGFWEEREWRIILSLFFPEHIASAIASKQIERSIENIKGNPEVIYKLNLKKFSFINPKGESLLEKIIIGPTANSEILVDSFSEILKNKGFDDEQIKNMITVSNIPLRY